MVAFKTTKLLQSSLLFFFFCQKTVVNPAPAENCHMQVYNLAGGDVAVTIRDGDLFPEPLHYLQVASVEGARQLVALLVAASVSNVLRLPLKGPPRVRDGSSAELQQDPEGGSHVSGWKLRV